MGRSLPRFIPPAPKTHGCKPVMHRSSDEPTPAPVLPLFPFSFFLKPFLYLASAKPWYETRHHAGWGKQPFLVLSPHEE